MRRGLQFVPALAGVLVVILIAPLDGQWFAIHVALTHWPPLPLSVWPWTRAVLVLLGLGLTIAGAFVGKWMARRPVREVLATFARVTLATALALVAAEVILRISGGQEALWRADRLEVRIGQPSARYGWVPVASRSTTAVVHGRANRYAIDAWGDRAASERGAPDPVRPSVVIAGESIAFGFALDYDESFGARLGADLGLQVVNTAYPGYGSDQAMLRLRDALDRLEHPKVAVITFVPAMLLRNVQDFRPRLVLEGGALAAVPPAGGLSALRLRDLLVNEVPFLSAARLERSLELTGAILEQTARVARAHGATPVFVVISVGPRRPFAAHPEAPLLRRLFVQPRLPFVLIDLDEADFIPGQVHPGAAAHRRIAQAVEACLEHGACAGAQRR